MPFKKISSEIERHIEELDLSPCEREVLFEIAVDPHGLPKETGYSMIARITGSSDELENQKILTNLISKGYLFHKDEGNLQYLRVDYDKVGIPEEVKEQLEKISGAIFEIIGEPHSPKGMETLKEVFENEEEIFISLGITSYEVFKDLIENRCKNDYRTTFFFPPKKSIKGKDVDHYKITLLNWRKFIKNSSQKIRKNISFRILKKPFEPLYTTLFSENIARFNIRKMGDSTRKGKIISTKPGTSLYEISKQLYKDMKKNSDPDIRVDFGKFLLSKFGKNYYFIIFAGLLFFLFLFDFFGVSWIQSFIMALLASLLLEILRGKEEWIQNNTLQRR